MVRDPGGLGPIWTTARTLQYYPLLFTTFWAEYRLWGLDPTGYHAVNVLLHALNAFLVEACRLGSCEQYEQECRR